MSARKPNVDLNLDQAGVELAEDGFVPFAQNSAVYWWNEDGTETPLEVK